MYGAWISPHCPMPCRIRLGTLTFDSHCQCQAVPGPPLQCKQPPFLAYSPHKTQDGNLDGDPPKSRLVGTRLIHKMTNTTNNTADKLLLAPLNQPLLPSPPLPHHPGAKTEPEIRPSAAFPVNLARPSIPVFHSNSRQWISHDNIGPALQPCGGLESTALARRSCLS